MEKLFYLSLYSATFLTCILRYGRFNLPRYKLFLPFLLLIVIYQYGSIPSWWMINGANLWSVNIETAIEFTFYSFFIITSYREPREKRVFGIVAGACLLFTVIDIFFIQGFWQLCSVAIVLQYAVLIVMVCRFFYGQMKAFDGETSLLKQPDFWVNTGLLFFSLSEFLFFSKFSLAYTAPHYFGILVDVMSGVANIILYSCLIIAFLCHPRSRKPYLQ